MTKRTILFLVSISLSILACSQEVTATEPVLNTPVINTQTPQPTATEDFIPTLSYIQTQQYSSELTAQAVVVIVLQATQQAEQFQQEQIRFTQQAEQLTAQAYQYTATAYSTSIVATQTQQAIVNTQISDYSTMQSSQATQISEAPQKAMELNTAENIKKYGWIQTLVMFVAMISISFLLVTVGLYLLRVPKIEKVIETVEVLPPIIPIQNAMRDEYLAKVELKKNSDTPFPQSKTIVFPCNAKQMDEIAEKVIGQGLSLAYDNFYGKDSEFTRETYAPVYSFLQANGLAKSTGVKNKGIIPSDLLIQILTEWRNNKQMLEGYSHLETTPLFNKHAQKTDENKGNQALIQVQHVQGTDEKPTKQLENNNSSLKMGEFRSVTLD